MLAAATTVKLLAEIALLALASRGHVAARLQLTQEAAVACLRQLTFVRPGQAVGWFNPGYVLQQAGRHDEAGPAFERAVALDLCMNPAWYGLALGWPDKARKVIAHLCRFEPCVAAQFERESEAAFAATGGVAHAAR
jgi:tetratricopeptide (TPR) repeat protein